jgi:hypothetical protein
MKPLDHEAARTMGAAAAAFLARADLTPQSRRSYAQTLSRIAAAIGADRPLVAPDTDEPTTAVCGRCRPNLPRSRYT